MLSKERFKEIAKAVRAWEKRNPNEDLRLVLDFARSTSRHLQQERAENEKLAKEIAPELGCTYRELILWHFQETEKLFEELGG